MLLKTVKVLILGSVWATEMVAHASVLKAKHLVYMEHHASEVCSTDGSAVRIPIGVDFDTVHCTALNMSFGVETNCQARQVTFSPDGFCHEDIPTIFSHGFACEDGNTLDRSASTPAVGWSCEDIPQEASHVYLLMNFTGCPFIGGFNSLTLRLDEDYNKSGSSCYPTLTSVSGNVEYYRLKVHGDLYNYSRYLDPNCETAFETIINADLGVQGVDEDYCVVGSFGDGIAIGRYDVAGVTLAPSRAPSKSPSTNSGFPHSRSNSVMLVLMTVTLMLLCSYV